MECRYRNLFQLHGYWVKHPLDLEAIHVKFLVSTGKKRLDGTEIKEWKEEI
jgi:hypothetical protein